MLETIIMIVLIQMVSIFGVLGFGLGNLVARGSVDPENLSSRPMLMAMIAVTPALVVAATSAVRHARTAARERTFVLAGTVRKGES